MKENRERTERLKENFFALDKQKPTAFAKDIQGKKALLGLSVRVSNLHQTLRLSYQTNYILPSCQDLKGGQL